MNLKEVSLKKISEETEEFSGAEIKAICTEAGFYAIRNNRDYATQEDFNLAIDKISLEDDEDSDNQNIFG
jgi:ATP-dependent 26S proteasome regulatory subunit